MTRNPKISIVEDAPTEQIAERDVAEAVTRYLKADGKRTEAALDGGAALNQLKESTPHGGFGEVLDRLPISQRTAQRWMRLAGADFKSATVADLGGIKSADQFLTGLRPGVDTVAAAQVALKALKAWRDFQALAEKTIAAGEKVDKAEHPEIEEELEELRSLLG